MLSRIFELREVKLFLVAKQKNDLLLAFGGDNFSPYLAHLANIFETLNQLNKKLQGPGSDMIVHTDAIMRLRQSSNFGANEQVMIILHHFTT